MSAPPLTPLERAELELLNADLMVKRAIVQGLAVDDDVRRAQAAMRDASRRIAAKLATNDGGAVVLPFARRPA